jgi:hypothetical protein
MIIHAPHVITFVLQNSQESGMNKVHIEKDLCNASDIQLLSLVNILSYISRRMGAVLIQ